jgi:hypothetical protein
VHKYRAVKTQIDGLTFASKKEARRYWELSLLQKVGEIKNLETQVPFELQCGFVLPKGEKVRPIKYVADFVYVRTSDGKTVVEDTKGMKTPAYEIKKKLFLRIYGQKYEFLET